MKEAKIIFSPQLANYLLTNGFQIIKLKPKHDNPEESVFVFQTGEGFFETIENWMTNNNK